MGIEVDDAFGEVLVVELVEFFGANFAVGFGVDFFAGVGIGVGDRGQSASVGHHAGSGFNGGLGGGEEWEKEGEEKREGFHDAGIL